MVMVDGWWTMEGSGRRWRSDRCQDLEVFGEGDVDFDMKLKVKNN